MMWREIECIAARGFTTVMTQWEHLRDTVIILMFLVGVVFEIIAYMVRKIPLFYNPGYISLGPSAPFQ